MLLDVGSNPTASTNITVPVRNDWGSLSAVGLAIFLKLNVLRFLIYTISTTFKVIQIMLRITGNQAIA